MCLYKSILEFKGLQTLSETRPGTLGKQLGELTSVINRNTWNWEAFSLQRGGTAHTPLDLGRMSRRVAFTCMFGVENGVKKG